MGERGGSCGIGRQRVCLWWPSKQHPQMRALIALVSCWGKMMKNKYKTSERSVCTIAWVMIHVFVCGSRKWCFCCCSLASSITTLATERNQGFVIECSCSVIKVSELMCMWKGVCVRCILGQLVHKNWVWGRGFDRNVTLARHWFALDCRSNYRCVATCGHLDVLSGVACKLGIELQRPYISSCVIWSQQMHMPNQKQKKYHSYEKNHFLNIEFSSEKLYRKFQIE